MKDPLLPDIDRLFERHEYKRGIGDTEGHTFYLHKCPHCKKAIKSEIIRMLEALKDPEVITYGGMGSDIPCVPIEKLDELIRRVK